MKVNPRQKYQTSEFCPTFNLDPNNETYRKLTSLAATAPSNGARQERIRAEEAELSSSPKEHALERVASLRGHPFHSHLSPSI